MKAGSPGSTALSFLKIDTGARPSAMAGAYTSYGNDPFVLFYNPALIAELSKHEIGLMHFEYFEDINYENISSAFKVSDQYSVGFGINYLYVNGINRTVRANNMEGYTTTGTFGSSDLLIVMGHSLKITEKMNIGLNLKYIKESIDKKSASTFAGDIGFYSKVQLLTSFNFGATVMNIGLPIKFIEKRESLPLLGRCGISKGFNVFGLNESNKKDINLSIDAEKPIDNDINIRGGTEVWLINMIAVRLGYRLNMNQNDLGDITLGGGLDINWFSFSYAFVPYKYLTNTHRFSVRVRF